jgi:acyl carrier protein
MDVREIYTRFNMIFGDVFDDDSIVLTPELSARDVAEWDSLAHIRLIVSVEKAFSIKFSAAEVGGLKNVGEFVDLVRSKL